MTKSEILTVEKLLAKKDLIKSKKNNYFSKTFGAEIEIRDLAPEVVTDILQSIDFTETEKYKRLIYESCPIFKQVLKNDEVKALYTDGEKLKEPYDIILKVLDNNLGDFYGLGNAIVERYGLLTFSDEVVNKVKKQ